MADDAISTVTGVDKSPTARQEPQLAADNVSVAGRVGGDVADIANVLASTSRREDLLSAAGAGVADLHEFQETPGTTCSSVRQAGSSSWTFKLRVQPPEIVLTESIQIQIIPVVC